MNALRALGITFVWFFICSFVSCGVLTAQYARASPHDGRDGLAEALGGINIGAFSSPVIFLVTWGLLTYRDRKRQVQVPKGL